MARFSLSVDSSSPEATFELGRELGLRLTADAPLGAPLALSGELGSGKTTFTKGLAAGLGVRAHDRVTSPTFVLRQEYRGRVPIIHYDAYRLSGAGELLALGFEEDLGAGVVVLEWADRAGGALPAESLRVEFEHAGGPATLTGTAGADAGRRRITFEGDSALWETRVRLAAGSAALVRRVRARPGPSGRPE